MDGSVDSFAHRTKEIMSSDCYACRLTEGVEPLPGGRIFATQHWVVDHCTGPLRVGTLTSSPSPLSPCRRSHRSGSSGSWSPRATGIPDRKNSHPGRPGFTSACGLMQDGSQGTFISSSSRPGTSGAERLAVLAPLCRRRCFKLETRRRSTKSRRSVFKQEELLRQSV